MVKYSEPVTGHHLHAFLVLGSLEQVPALQCYIEGKDHVPRPAGNTPPNTAQDTAGHLCSQGTLLPHIQLRVHQNLSNFSAEQFPRWAAPKHVPVPVTVPPQV